MTDNLALWHRVEKTPESQTKPITGKAYKGTSPKPYYLVQKATETFGPIGIGWGFDIVEEKLLDGALLEPGFYERIHMAKVRVWYKWGDARGEVEHVGQTAFSGRRKGDGQRPGAPFTDEDAPKKSVTDALIKALSMIGFAGDIFMGRYDDSKYVSDLKAEEAAAKAPARQQQPKAVNGAYVVKGGKNAAQWVDLLAGIANQAPDDASRREIAAANGPALKKLADASPDEYRRAMVVLGINTQERTAA